MDCLVASRSMQPQLQDDLTFPNFGQSNIRSNETNEDDNDNSGDRQNFDQDSDSDSIEDSNTSKLMMRNIISNNVVLPLDSVPSSSIPKAVLAEIIEYNIRSAERERTFDGQNTFEAPLSSMINKNPYTHLKHTNNADDDKQSSCSSSSLSELGTEDEDENDNQEDVNKKYEGRKKDTTSSKIVKVDEKNQYSQNNNSDFDLNSTDEENSDDYETIEEFPASSVISDGADSISDSENSKATNDCKNVLFPPPSPSPTTQFQHEDKSKHNDKICNKSSTIQLSDNDPDPELKKKRKREKKERRKDLKLRIGIGIDVDSHNIGTRSRSISSASSNTNTNKSSNNNTIKSLFHKNHLAKPKERGRPVQFHRLSSLNFDTHLIKGHLDQGERATGAKNSFNSSATGRGAETRGMNKKVVNSNVLDSYLYVAVPESSTLKEACTKMYREDPITGQILEIKRMKQDDQSEVSSLHLNEKRNRERMAFIRRVHSRNLWGIGPRLTSGATLVSECVMEDAKIIPTNESNNNNCNADDDDDEEEDFDNETGQAKKTKKIKTMVDVGVQYPPMWSWENKTRDKNSSSSNIKNKNNIPNIIANRNINKEDQASEEYDGVFIEDVVKFVPQPKFVSESKSTSTSETNFNINKGDGDKFPSFFLYESGQTRTNEFLLAPFSSTSSLVSGWKPGFSSVTPPFYERPGTPTHETFSSSTTFTPKMTNRRLVAISRSQIVSSNPESGSCECFLEPLIYPVQDNNTKSTKSSRSKHKNDEKTEIDWNTINNNNEMTKNNCLQQVLKDENNNYHTFNLITVDADVGSSNLPTNAKDNEECKNTNVHKNKTQNTNNKNSKIFNTSSNSSTTTFSNHPRKDFQFLKGTSPATSHETDNTTTDIESKYDSNNYFSLDGDDPVVVKITSAEELAQHLRQFSLKISQSRSKQGKDKGGQSESAFLTAALENRNNKGTQINHTEKKRTCKENGYKWNSSYSYPFSSSNSNSDTKESSLDLPSRPTLANSVQPPLELKAGLSMQKLLKLNPVQRLKYMRDSYKQNFWPRATALAPSPANISSSRPKSRSSSRPHPPTDQQQRQDVEYQYAIGSSFKPTTLSQQKYVNSNSKSNSNNNIQSYTVRSLANWISPNNPTKNWNGTGLMMTNAIMDFTEAAITSNKM